MPQAKTARSVPLRFTNVSLNSPLDKLICCWHKQLIQFVLIIPGNTHSGARLTLWRNPKFPLDCRPTYIHTYVCTLSNMFSHSAKCEASFKFAALIDFPYSRHSRRRSSPALADADAMSRPGCHFWCRLPQIWGALPVMIINLAICSACRVATLHCLLARGLLQIEHCLKAGG